MKKTNNDYKKHLTEKEYRTMILIDIVLCVLVASTFSALMIALICGVVGI